jgi:hypothetical protein
MGTAGTLYRGLTMADAQALVDEHPIALNGRCLACGCDVEDCDARRTALRRLGLEHLPRRRPGATRPELVGARRIV